LIGKAYSYIICAVMLYPVHSFVIYASVEKKKKNMEGGDERKEQKTKQIMFLLLMIIATSLNYF